MSTEAPTGKGLVDHAKKFVIDQVAEQTGEQDFMPFMLLNCNVGHIYAGLMMPEGNNKKNRLAENMMALVAVHRPSEVMFVSPAWMVLRKDKTELDRSLPVSKQADRIEAVIMVHHTDSTDSCDSYSAPVIRESGKVSLGEWDDCPGIITQGRFAEAIQRGMFIAEQLPEEMREYLDAEIEAGRAGDAAQIVLRAMNKVREAASKN